MVSYSGGWVGGLQVARVGDGGGCIASAVRLLCLHAPDLHVSALV